MSKNKETGDPMEAVATAGQNEAKAATDNEKTLVAKQLNDYKDSLQRLQAEFENYKKRVEKEKAQFRQFAAAEVVKSFLPVLDSFELALKSVSSNGNKGSSTPPLSTLRSSEKETAAAANDKVMKGMEMIYAQFYSALEFQGLRPIKAVGEKLDPYRHEVLMQEETADEKRDGVVVEEFQKGYALNDVILRYSKVKVLKFAAKEKERSEGKSEEK